MFEDEKEIITPKTKIKCRTCTHLNYDYLQSRYETFEEAGNYYCGVHGRAAVDPDGQQVNLNRRGGCGYYPKQRPPKQLSLFDLMNL